jgi:hypothetical protein
VQTLKKAWQFDFDPTAPKTNVHRYNTNRRESPSNIYGMPVFQDGRIYVAGGGDLFWGKLSAWMKCIDARETGVAGKVDIFLGLRFDFLVAVIDYQNHVVAFDTGGSSSGLLVTAGGDLAAVELAGSAHADALRSARRRREALPRLRLHDRLATAPEHAQSKKW